METIIAQRLKDLRLGEPQSHRNVTVIPVTGPESGPDYLTLKEAMDNGSLVVGEVSEGGAVPELKVVNKGVKPVLLLDGEELSGAKQNRVLNTTILIRINSQTIIPVSCTEHGRWSYRTAAFEDSGIMMSSHLRRVKNESVARSLKERQHFRSDQHAVWDGIEEQAKRAGVHSSTGAMKDIHESRIEDLESFLAHFALMENQQGLIVLVNGQVAGMDLVSMPKAYGVLHTKLLKSYVMDALLHPTSKENGAMAAPETARTFLGEICLTKEERFVSVGCGWDYRYESPGIVGSALVHEEAVIHLAFFRTVGNASKTGPMATASHRRQYRTRRQ